VKFPSALLTFLIYLLFVLFFAHKSFSATDTVSIRQWLFRFVADDCSHSYASDTNLQKWQSVEIPHSFNLKESLGKHTTGYGWYKTELKIRSKKDSEYFLEFDGVCLRSKVFINGLFAGECNQAYMPFKVNISKFIYDKNKVHIAVQVDNQLRQNDFPDHNCDGWWIYGGLIRGVRLASFPKNHIENCQIRTFYITDNKYLVIVSFDNVVIKPDSLVLSIKDFNNSSVITKCFSNCPASPCSLVVNGVKPWNSDTPYLYNFSIMPYWKSKAGRLLHYKKGFAQLQVLNGSLNLNGKPIFLRGIGRHDVLGDKGPLLTRHERLADLVAIKSTGANMLRIAHFPQHQDIYELCDSLGLIVMDEMPAWKSYPGFLGDTLGQRMASEYMSSLISAHGNYTCIGIWCIGNEISSVENRIAMYVKYMADFTRRTDPSRLVTYTSYFYQFDKAYQYVDVASVNEYFGWYLGSINMLTSLFASIKKECPAKPIIVTEFGASASIGIRNPDASMPGPIVSVFTKDYSEDFQALFHQNQIETIWKNRKNCSGAVVWCYNDFMEYRERPNPEELQPGMNGMGLVTKDRKQKLALEVVKKSFMFIKKSMENDGGY
jgi:beta-galactosidase